MTAGIKTLEIMGRSGSYEHLTAMSKRVVEGILEAGREAGHAVCGGYIGGAEQSFFDPTTSCCNPVMSCAKCN